MSKLNDYFKILKALNLNGSEKIKSECLYLKLIAKTVLITDIGSQNQRI